MAVLGCSGALDLDDYTSGPATDPDAGKPDAGQQKPDGGEAGMPRPSQPDAGIDDASTPPKPVPDATVEDPEDGAVPEEDAAVPPPPQIGETLQKLALWACKGVTDCESKRGLAATQADATRYCHPEWVERQLITPLQEAVDAGTIVADMEVATACLAALPSETQCPVEPLAPSVEACQGLLTGTLAQGAACDNDVVCAPGLVCVGNDQTCSGTCEPPGKQSAPCVDDGDCDARFSCNPNGCGSRGTAGLPCRRDANCLPGHYCDAQSMLCAKAAAMDEPCELRAPQTCADNLLCVEDGGAGVCGTGVDLGGSCSEDRPCARGRRCVNGTCGTIAAPDTQCNSNAQCSYGRTCGDACEPRPILGEPCDGPDDTSTRAARCLEGICQGGTCVLGNSDEACSLDDTPFEICEGYCTGTVCAEYKMASDECAGDEECTPGLLCVEDTSTNERTCQAAQCSP